MKRLLAIFVVWRNDTDYISKNMATLIDKDDNVLTDSNDVNDVLQEVKKLYERRYVEDCEISQMVTETDSTFE